MYSNRAKLVYINEEDEYDCLYYSTGFDLSGAVTLMPLVTLNNFKNSADFERWMEL